VDYLASGHVYRDYVRNVSLAGASIGCRDFFIPGEKISIAFPLANSANQINGEIVWVDTDAFGIVFKSVGPKCKELSLSPPEPAEGQPLGIRVEVKIAGKIKRKRIRWYRSPGTEVIKYRLYWSAQAEVDYDSQYVELGDVAEAILPDDLPSFPLITGTLHLGITALSKAGNESDMTKISAALDFTVPEAPKQIWIEDP
jgi:PilZ domain